MADSGNMSWSRSSENQKRDEGSDDTAMEMKHHKNNMLPVDQAKTTNMERLVTSTNIAVPNRCYLPPDTVEEILELLPFKSNERFRSVSKSLFTFLATPKLLYCPCEGRTEFFQANYGIKSSDDQRHFTAVVLSEYSGDVRNLGLATMASGETIVWNPFTGICRKLPLRNHCTSAGTVSVCLQVSHHGKWEIFVWNPLTSVCRKLPHKSSAYANVFGYASASDDYKVFAATGSGSCRICVHFIPQSFKDGRYVMLQFVHEEIHVLKWNNTLDESDEAEKYSRKIEF
ncbi:hypothetical protein Tsubulata_030134 [Turnera subulata]|uniref:F-box domain-containing protein n=1 Tax=Turnera subulata TaxID=218843 RepID=A0A9Q0FSA7_9ROSI|nr:hypothetical protein Tsubulata_030134 [Turnera subulata]